MNTKPTIECNCGQRIISKDVMQTGYYLRLFGPSFVYVKFRCSHCKKLGEQFVKQEDWEDGILKDIPSEVDQTETQRFETLGPISLQEQINFHFRLDDADAFARLPEHPGLQDSLIADMEDAETR